MRPCVLRSLLVCALDGALPAPRLADVRARAGRASPRHARIRVQRGACHQPRGAHLCWHALTPFAGGWQLKKYFTFEVQVLDDKNVRRRFRASNYQSTTRVKPFICTMPMRLDEGWNQIQFNLSDFTRRAYGTNYIETLRVQIHANCRIRRCAVGPAPHGCVCVCVLQFLLLLLLLGVSGLRTASVGSAFRVETP
jgi:hypothetical protein